MPRLAKNAVRQVAAAEAVSGGFELLRPGKYRARLFSVEARESSTGKPGWNVQFNKLQSLDGEETYPGRQFMWMTLPGTPEPKDEKSEEHKKWETTERLSAGRLKAFFQAFGYTEDSDTDEMLGERCVLRISIDTIQAGARKGEQQNSVREVLPMNDDDLEDLEETDDETAF